MFHGGDGETRDSSPAAPAKLCDAPQPRCRSGVCDEICFLSAVPLMKKTHQRRTTTSTMVRKSRLDSDEEMQLSVSKADMRGGSCTFAMDAMAAILVVSTVLTVSRFRELVDPSALSTRCPLTAGVRPPFNTTSDLSLVRVKRFCTLEVSLTVQHATDHVSIGDK